MTALGPVMRSVEKEVEREAGAWRRDTTRSMVRVEEGKRMVDCGASEVAEWRMSSAGRGG